MGGRDHLAVYRSGQCPFLPHARFKTKGERKCRSCCVLHSSDLICKEEVPEIPLKYRKQKEDDHPIHSRWLSSFLLLLPLHLFR